MKQFRKELKLTQYELATLIGVSRSVVALHEKGLRNLSLSATVRLARLKLLWHQAGTGKAAFSAGMRNRFGMQEQQTISLLRADVQRAAAGALRISQRLSYMEQRHRSLRLKLQFIQTLMQETHPASRQMRFLQAMEQDTLNAMTNCCPAQQQWTAYKLRILNAWKQAAQQSAADFSRE